MELEGIMPSETSQTEKDKYHMIILKLRVNLCLYVTSQIQRKVIAKSRGYKK